DLRWRLDDRNTSDGVGQIGIAGSSIPPLGQGSRFHFLVSAEESESVTERTPVVGRLNELCCAESGSRANDREGFDSRFEARIISGSIAVFRPRAQARNEPQRECRVSAIPTATIGHVAEPRNRFARTRIVLYELQ